MKSALFQDANEQFKISNSAERSQFLRVKSKWVHCRAGFFPQGSLPDCRQDGMWEQPKLTIACLPKMPTSDISASLRRRMRLRTVEGQTRDTILVNIEQLYVDGRGSVHCFCSFFFCADFK